MDDPRPMTEQPNAVEKGTGLGCFMDQLRVCGPDCVAFLNPPPQNDPEYQGQPWSRCHMLVNVHRAGKHLVILTSDVHRLLTKQPGANIPPPVPR